MTQELVYPKAASRAQQESSVSRRFLVRLARGAMFALIVQVLGAGLAYLSQVAFARWMGIAQFGRYTYFMAWATILALLAGLGFPLSVLRFIPEYRAHGDHARLRGFVRLSRGAALATGLASAGVGLVIALAFAPGKTVAIVALAVWLVPVGALINVDLAVIRAGGRIIGAYGPSLVIRPLLILLAAGAVWLVEGRLTASTAFIITLSAFGVVALLQSKLVAEVVRGGGRRSSAVYEPRRWLRVSAPLLLVAGFQIALGQTDLLVVGAVRGVRDAGLYSAAAKTATLVGYLLVALNAVTAPLIAEFEAKGDRAGLQRLATVSALWVFWPTLAIAVGLAVLAPFVLGLFGPSFVIARWALVILLGGQLVSAGCGAVGYLMSMTGHQNEAAWVYGIVSVVNIPVCYGGVRFFGLDGAAAATSVSLIAWNVWLHHLTKQRIGVRASILSSLALQRATRVRSNHQ
jgi:O-antigen/teichoic acid export membrane protein